MLTCMTFMFLQADLQSGKTGHAFFFFFAFNFSAVLCFYIVFTQEEKGLKVNSCFVVLVLYFVIGRQSDGWNEQHRLQCVLSSTC